MRFRRRAPRRAAPRRAAQHENLGPSVIKAFADKFRGAAPGFVKYFEENYVSNWEMWLRAAIIGPHTEPWRIPTGTQVAESYHGHMKEMDLSGRCVRARLARPAARMRHAIKPLQHARVSRSATSAGSSCVRAAWTGC